jgi:hypothetical protein
MSRPTRTLTSHPDLTQLKRQAKELLKDFAAGNAAAAQRLLGTIAGRMRRASRYLTPSWCWRARTVSEAGLRSKRSLMAAGERLTLATMVLDAGARLDLRDTVLLSTPLGWACRWGRIELVRLFLNRGADPIEAGAQPWARPRAWAEKMNRRDVIDTLAG